VHQKTDFQKKKQIFQTPQPGQKIRFSGKKQIYQTPHPRCANKNEENVLILQLYFPINQLIQPKVSNPFSLSFITSESQRNAEQSQFSGAMLALTPKPKIS